MWTCGVGMCTIGSVPHEGKEETFAKLGSKCSQWLCPGGTIMGSWGFEGVVSCPCWSTLLLPWPRTDCAIPERSTWTHWNLSTTPRARDCYHLCFPGKKTEAQRDEGTCPRRRSWHLAGPDLQTRMAWLHARDPQSCLSVAVWSGHCLTEHLSEPVLAWLDTGVTWYRCAWTHTHTHIQARSTTLHGTANDLSPFHRRLAT